MFVSLFTLGYTKTTLQQRSQANETQLVPPLEWLDSGDATQLALVLPGGRHRNGASGDWNFTEDERYTYKPNNLV